VGSKGRRGNPYENAKAKSFLRTLEHDEREVHLSSYEIFADVVARLPRFLERCTMPGGCTPRSAI
jgi:putative transposase